MANGLCALGEMPEFGAVPDRMHALTVRRDRHGNPRAAMRLEIVDVPTINPNEVLVHVMAAGINYNGVWAALGKPISVLDFHKHPFHIPGSDASGIVWKVGSAVKHWNVGDEVVVHCNQTCGQCDLCNGGDPMFCREERIWGYETPFGSFAQFTSVQAQQLLPKPKHLTWEAAASYGLVLSTAYRMLFGHEPHTLKPGQNVLVWGASGGLGSMAIQLARLVNAGAIAVVSSDERGRHALKLGATGYVKRGDFSCWGTLPDPKDRERYGAYLKEVRRFGRAIWAFAGDGVDVDLVLEHPGEQTFPVSVFLVKRGGMVVFCAGTTGFNLTFDAAYAWMRQKRIQGSHFATRKQASEANRLVLDGKIDPCLSRVFSFDETPLAHELMMRNEHPPGNMAVLVQAPAAGLKNLNEALAAQAVAAVPSAA